MDNLDHMELIELDDGTLTKVDGGFVALTILGVTYSATTVAAAMGAATAAGVAAGVAAAAASDK
jgi:hypothetical protein